MIKTCWDYVSVRAALALGRLPGVWRESAGGLNDLPSGPVLPGMRIHRRHGLPEPPAEGADPTTGAPGRRKRWRSRRRDRADVRQVPGSDTSDDQPVHLRAQQAQAEQALTGRAQAARAQAEQAQAEQAQAAKAQAAAGETMAAAMQLAIALLTAGLDSPELEAWAADMFTPSDANGLGDFMAGLHVISVLLLNELHEVTGEPSAAILQRLAILAECQRGTPFGE